MKRGGIALAATLAALVAIGGCGSATRVGDRIAGPVLTLYASVPLHGASGVSGAAVANGERLALAQLGGRIGKYRVVLKLLDDSTATRGEWDPGQTTLNARQAIADKTTIGYLGEFNSGASAVSIPLLNRLGIAQISPASAAVGLTSGAAGASPGEPQKYYPTGVRTFARVVPSDAVQASAQVKLQQSRGCTRTYVLDDGEVDGEDTAITFDFAAQAAHLSVVATQTFPQRATDYSSLAAGVAASGADCVLISAITDSGTVLLTKQLAAAATRIKIFASAGTAESTFTDPDRNGIPETLDPRVLITAAPLGQSAYPPAAGAFFRDYERRYGVPEPYAILGYEAMSLMLSAITTATDHGTKPASRSKVLAAVFSTRNRPGAVGTYSIDRNGDTTLARYGVYRVIGGVLTFWEAVQG
jgi:branched-chain amino acid transport system substrate-binding protein